MTQNALVILTCLLAAACASGTPAPRPLASGFGAEAGVADPYADGKRHLAAGNDELAVQRFGQALAHDRRSLDALNGLAIAYTRLGRFDSAQSQFERALQIDPTSALTLNNYGWSLIEQGRLREANAFLALARRHATAAEAPVVAANLERIRRAGPPAVVAALEQAERPQTPRGPHRLVRVDDNAWRLETATQPVGPLLPPGSAHDRPLSPVAPQHEATAIVPEEPPTRPDAPTEPSVVVQDIDAAGAAPAAAEQAPPAEPRPEVAPRPARAGPIQLWPRPAPEAESEAEAGPILPGERT